MPPAPNEHEWQRYDGAHDCKHYPKQQISSPCQSEGLTVRERFLWDHAATLELAALALNPGFTANCTSADNRREYGITA